ncbi:hypothetical protein AK812_SmicGene11404 [Symbiodinium microadriaticum]|uniref:Uncharacterized protein n=1 Tax=Symbiodinium microadriaticum TaxID=2951 RepID=A0A1Q9ED89_SYMMI|nr:hypothetical protein AK812_SmicGene11404 [Symbiodinium microadriaticum]
MLSMCRYAVLRSESQTKVPSDTTMVGMSEEYVVGFFLFPAAAPIAKSTLTLPERVKLLDGHIWGRDAVILEEDDYRLVVDSEHDRTSTRLITAHSLPQLMGRFLMGIGIGLATRSYLSEVVLPEQRGGVFAFCLRLPCADGRVHCAGAAKVDVADKWIQPFVILLAVLEEISSLRRPGAEKCLETYPSGRGSLEELSKDADTADTAEGPCLGLEPAAAVLNQACASTSILIYAQKRNAQDLLTLTVGAKRMLLGVGGGLSTVALLILRCCLAKSRAAVDWHELLYCHLRQHLGIGYWIVACRGHCCGRAALCLGIAQSVSTATLFAAGWLTTLTFRDVISLGPAGLLIYVLEMTARVQLAERALMGSIST